MTVCQNCGAKNEKKNKHMIDLTDEPDGDEYATRNVPCSLFAADYYLTRVHSAGFLDGCPVTSVSTQICLVHLSESLTCTELYGYSRSKSFVDP